MRMITISRSRPPRLVFHRTVLEWLNQLSASGGALSSMLAVERSALVRPERAPMRERALPHRALRSKWTPGNPGKRTFVGRHEARAAAHLDVEVAQRHANIDEQLDDHVVMSFLLRAAFDGNSYCCCLVDDAGRSELEGIENTSQALGKHSALGAPCLRRFPSQPGMRTLVAPRHLL